MRRDKNVKRARAAKDAHKLSHSLLATSRKDVIIYKLDELCEVVRGIVGGDQRLTPVWRDLNLDTGREGGCERGGGDSCRAPTPTRPRVMLNWRFVSTQVGAMLIPSFIFEFIWNVLNAESCEPPLPRPLFALRMI